MSWTEVGMLFAGFLFGTLYWLKEIKESHHYRAQMKQLVKNQQAYRNKP